MIKKTNLIRIFSFILVLCMCATMMPATALASDTTTFDETAQVVGPDEPAVTSGAVLATGSMDFVNSGTIYVYLDSGNWSADFLAMVTGNAGASYEVVVTTPGGSSFTDYVTSNYGTFKTIATLVFASSGLYRFKFTRLTGNASSAHALVEICD